MCIAAVYIIEPFYEVAKQAPWHYFQTFILLFTHFSCFLFLSHHVLTLLLLKFLIFFWFFCHIYLPSFHFNNLPIMFFFFSSPSLFFHFNNVSLIYFLSFYSLWIANVLMERQCMIIWEIFIIQLDAVGSWDTWSAVMYWFYKTGTESGLV